MRGLIRIVVCGLAVGGSGAVAQWSVMALPLGSASATYATCVWGDRVIGYRFNNQYNRGYWLLPNLAWVDKPDVFAFAKNVYGGTSGGHASAWIGDGAAIDLNPAGASSSQVWATDGSQLVGSAGASAAVWDGTASSYRALTAPGASSSAAYGVAGGVQVGAAYFGNVYHAMLWRGDAASAVDLHSGPARSQSTAYATTGPVQVGVFEYIDGGGQPSMPTVWRGTAESRRFLSVGPAFSGMAKSISRSVIGGSVSGPYGPTHAAVWMSEYATPEDLSSLLPSDMTYSSVASVYSSGSKVHVVVNAYNSSYTIYRAYLFTRAIARGRGFGR